MAKRFGRVKRRDAERPGICSRCLYWDAFEEYDDEGRRAYPDEGVCRRGLRHVQTFYPNYLAVRLCGEPEDPGAHYFWKGEQQRLHPDELKATHRRSYEWPRHAWNDWCFEFQDWRE